MNLSILISLPLFLGAVPYHDKANLMVYRDEAGKEHPVKTVKDWEVRRKHILENMQEVMGPLPAASAKVPLEVKVDEEVRTEKYIRKKLTYAVAKGERVRAYLFLPLPAPKGKVPGVLCLHQTNGDQGADSPAGIAGRPTLYNAKELAEQGYVTLAPDYPSFGTYKYDFSTSPFVSGSMKAIFNNMCAIDLLQALPEVDGTKIGCIGHSLGGHNTMFTAAFDERIGCLVSSCGFTAFPKYYGGKLKGWTSDRYMPRIATKYDLDPKKVPFDFPEVVGAFAPRAFFTCSPLKDGNFEVSGVKDCMEAARPVYDLFKAGEKLRAVYPDAGHEFVDEARREAYAFMDRWLKGK